MRTAIIGIENIGAKNLSKITETIKSLNKSVQIDRASSIYQKTEHKSLPFTDIKNTLGTSFCLSLVVIFEGTSKDLGLTLSKVQSMANKNLNNEKLILSLLAVEDEVSMLPSLPLPHPQLHRRSDFLVPSAEIYPNYEHPVIEKTLHQIQSFKDIDGHVFFYAQSKQLLNL